MLRTLIILSVLAVFGLTSCQKTVSKKACFTFSKTSAKVGDTIFVFNCSEGYQRCMWNLPNGVVDTSRHTVFVPTASGINSVGLVVGDYLLSDTVGVVKTLDVQP